MVSILEELHSGLRDVTGLLTFSELPADSFKLPLIVIAEVNNQSDVVAMDGLTEIATLTYNITIYCENEDDIYKYQDMIDEYMRTNVKRFNAQYSQIRQKYPIYYRQLKYSGTVRKIGNQIHIL